MRDSWRNFGSCLTERLRVKPIWSYYVFDLRLGFKRNGKWRTYIQWPPWKLKPVTQNFWNGIFTLNVYILAAWAWKIPVLIPRIGMVIRFAGDWWFEAGIGYLFDRGEFGGKLTIMNWEVEEKYNPGVNAWGWEEGPV